MAKRSVSASRQHHRRQAFTLAELLIVIAIIAVLIGILLPALSAARRSSAAVKCLSSLKQIGSAFQQYAQDNRRFFPVVRWNPGALPGRPSILGGGGIGNEDPANTTERIWVDFLAKYLVKKETYGNPDNYLAIQSNSVFWGCPAFNTAFFDKNAAIDALNGSKRYSMGYGMSRLAIGPYKYAAFIAEPTATPLIAPSVTVNGTPYQVLNLADLTQNIGGQFFKMEQWGRKGANKGLIMDSNGFNISASNNWSRAADSSNPPTAQTQPKLSGTWGVDYPVSGAPTYYISIDASRHLAGGQGPAKLMKQRGANVLFVDGHAAPASAREAWISMYGAGIDITNP